MIFRFSMVFHKAVKIILNRAPTLMYDSKVSRYGFDDVIVVFLNKVHSNSASSAQF